MLPTHKESIIKLLDRTFNKGAWHGPSVMEVLDDVTQEVAMHRLKNSHSIIALVGHMTTWRTFVVDKLQGVHYEVDDSRNFPVATNWLSALADLRSSQEQLVDAIRNSDELQWGELVPHGSYKYTFLTLLHGIIHHDLYHIGQISLIKKDFQSQLNQG